jgi:hypothetical protein
LVADETYIGGKPKNKHRQGQGRKPYGPGSKTGVQYDKTAVLSLIDKGTGEVRSRVMTDVTAASLRKAIAEQVDLGATVLHTDKHPAYKQVGWEMAGHEAVDHSRNEYVRGDVSTNQAENFFGQLKRSIDGTHHRVSTVHLHRYLAEFDYRYTTRELSDTARMRRMIGQTAGRRLSYRPLRGH